MRTPPVLAIQHHLRSIDRWVIVASLVFAAIDILLVWLLPTPISYLALVILGAISICVMPAILAMTYFFSVTFRTPISAVGFLIGCIILGLVAALNIWWLLILSASV